MLYLEVSEDGNPRASYDINLYKSGLVVADAAGQPLRVVGNLPYNISTPILFHLLAVADRVQDQHFMLQKEVVDRMAAAPGGKDYG